MDFPHDVIRQLDALTAALNGSGDDLSTIMSVLADDLTVGISSFSGLSITVHVGGEPVTVTAMDSHLAAASMLLPLTTQTGGGHIVFYAENPGAFTDLAADARIMLGPGGGGGDVVVDGHLPPPTAADAQAGLGVLTDRASIDQAIGFLLGRGYPPERARAELRRRAAAAGASLAWVAQQILHSGPPPDPDDADDGDDGERDEQTG